MGVNPHSFTHYHKGYLLITIAIQLLSYWFSSLTQYHPPFYRLLSLLPHFQLYALYSLGAMIGKEKPEAVRDSIASIHRDNLVGQYMVCGDRGIL